MKFRHSLPSMDRVPPQLINLAIFILTASLSTVPSSPLTVLLVFLILYQTVAQDLLTRRFYTPPSLFAGSIVAYSVTIASFPWIAAFAKAVLVLVISCTTTAAIYLTVLVALKLSHIVTRRTGSTNSLFYLFPWIWAGLWSVYGEVHSLGRLLSWTPVASLQPLSTPILPIFGLVGCDFVVALVALTVLETFGAYKTHTSELPLLDLDSDAAVVSATETDRLLPTSQRARPGTAVHPSSTTRTAKLVSFLLLVVFVIFHSIDSATTPALPVHESVRIACIRPPPSTHDWPYHTLSDYVFESSVVSGRGAKVLLWPEGAVSLPAPADNQSLHEQISDLAKSRKVFVGTAYTTPSTEVRGKELNAFTLFNPDGNVEFRYYKQALVPIVESYSFIRGNDSMQRARTVNIPYAHQHHKKHLDTLQTTLSAAICHDTSFPHILRQWYPTALTLVPAEVDSEPISWNRITQLQASAKSLGSAYLVCDNSDVGISAYINNRGQLRYWQKGGPSFELNADIAHARPTAYGNYGESGALAIILGCLIGVALLETVWKKGQSKMHRIRDDIVGVLRHKWEDFRGRGHQEAAGGGEEDGRDSLI